MFTCVWVIALKIFYRFFNGRHFILLPILSQNRCNQLNTKSTCDRLSCNFFFNQGQSWKNTSKERLSYKLQSALSSCYLYKTVGQDKNGSLWQAKNGVLNYAFLQLRYTVKLNWLSFCQCLVFFHDQQRSCNLGTCNLRSWEDFHIIIFLSPVSKFSG